MIESVGMSNVGDGEMYRVFFHCDESLSLFPGAEHAPRFGGAGLHMYLLSSELAKDPGFEVSFVFETSVEGADGGAIKLLNKRPVISRGIPILSRRLNRLRNSELYDGGGRKVLIATMAAYAPFLLREAAIAGGKSIFQTASETDVYAPRGFAEEEQQAILDAIAGADAVVVQTEQQQTKFNDMRGRDSLVIRKGMPIPKMPADSEKNGVLWVGSAQALKQPWYFLDLAREFPDEQFTMVIPDAGEPMFDYVRRQAREIPNLILVDRQVPYHQVQAYFDAAKIFVYTSEFGTDPAITVLQAAMGGCAILSQRLDPDEGMFENKGAGLCAHGDWADLKCMLAQLLENDVLRRNLGARAYEYVERTYNIKTMVDAYKTLIRGMF